MSQIIHKNKLATLLKAQISNAHLKDDVCFWLFHLYNSLITMCYDSYLSQSQAVVLTFFNHQCEYQL